MSLLKQLGLVKEGKSLHLFWQLFRAARALFVIITLLLVFTKWQLQVLRNTVQSVIARSLGNSKSELWTPISKDIKEQEKTKAAGIAVFVLVSLTAANKRQAFVVVYIAAKPTCRDQNGIFHIWQKIFEDQ